MKKKILGILLTVVLLLSCVISPAMAASDAWVKLATADGSLHLRKGPGKNYGSAGYVKHGDAIDIYFGDTGVDADGEEWTHITVERTGKSGYIKTKYISDAKVGGSSSGPTVYVSRDGGSLNVRKGPSTDYGIAGYVKHGQSIQILSEGSGWSKIKVVKSGVTGYIKNKYIVGLSGASTPTPSAPSTGSSYDVASVMTKTSAGKVNLRKGAGTGYATVGSLSRGTRLKVYGQSGNWYKVSTLNGLSGYISSNYLAFGVTGQTTAKVNFRKGAGTGYGVISSLSKGANVTIHSVSGSWAKVTANGRDGYVSMKYLNLGK